MEIRMWNDPQSIRSLFQIFQNIQCHNEDTLSKKIWKSFLNQSQTEGEFQRKMDLWDIFQE